MKWIDVSIPLENGLTVWPGDTSFAFEPDLRIARGDMCNVSRVAMSSHTATHVDAPWHFEDAGKRLHEVDAGVYMGQALVIDAFGKARIDTSDLGSASLPPRVLLKTDNSKQPIDRPFQQDYVALTPDAAQRLVDEDVQLIGIDYLSIAPFDDPETVHHILLGNEVMIVDGLRLEAIPPGTHEFVVLPLALQDADGAPARAFIGLA